jgi:hypothetical protein
MGKKSSPKAPDYTQLAETSKYAADLAYKQSQEQMAWAKEMWAEQKDLLNQVLGPQLDIMKAQYEAGMKDRARYEQLYQPLEENLVQEFTNYSSPERIRLESGRAQAQVRMAQDAAREGALARLEGYGIDPSVTRNASLDRNARAMEAAQVAAAGNVARKTTEDTGRALRAEAINIGKGYPSNVAGSYGQSLTAGNSAIGNMTNTVGMGANTMGTGMGWQAQGLNATNQAANIQNMGFQNQMSAAQMKNSNSMAPWELVAGVGGAWLGGMAEGGAIPEDVTQPPAPSDTVPAMLTPGEYVIPADVVARKGTEFFDRLVEKTKQQALPIEGQSERIS